MKNVFIMVLTLEIMYDVYSRPTTEFLAAFTEYPSSMEQMAILQDRLPHFEGSQITNLLEGKGVVVDSYCHLLDIGECSLKKVKNLVD